MPNKPEPTVNREFKIETAVMATAWLADTVTTHQAFARCSACVEGGAFFPGSRSTAEVTGAWAALDIGAAVAAYEWKRHVRNRYLHPLWRGFLYERIYAHNSAAINNWRIRP